ncbi:hypothetical protein GCM10025868_05970 [Angustibacter aerolatus]|uniref:Uncharacterized protein n=1 Tax=Angustibacter aerolatus TaxID=1162965 RepID=A0ABQ6JAZ0_9ACTN|nr:hypothetical protein [Angustibacter aerolatus]GMA85347.1 hypothetical protein GCM10025868_05970 [Angustibacter aerolatus]
MSLGALVVGQQHRDVLAGAGGWEHDRLDAEPPHPLQARRPAVAVGVHHDLGAARERPVGHRVHVAHDHVEVQAGLEHGVRSPSTPMITGLYSRT